MRYRLELLKPKVDVNGFGEEAASFSSFRSIHAERVKASGNRSEEVGEHFADYRVEFNIRDAHPVREGWRVKDRSGYEYTVTNIIPNRDRGMLTLICQRVNL